MEKLLQYLGMIIDLRQEKKVMHKMSDIIAIVFLASLANARDWIEIHYFAEEHEEFLRKYLELPNSIPSHDTIQRVFAMVSAEFCRNFSKNGTKCSQAAKVKK